MKYAVIEIGGRQQLIRIGQIFEVDQLKLKPGEKFEAEKVLMVGEPGQKAKFGSPYLKDEKVLLKVVDHFRGKKVRVATFKAKARTRRVLGFRSALTSVEVISIGETPKKTAPKKPAPKKK